MCKTFAVSTSTTTVLIAYPGSYPYLLPYCTSAPTSPLFFSYTKSLSFIVCKFILMKKYCVKLLSSLYELHC